MYKLHAATRPKCASDTDLRFCSISTPAPHAIVGKSMLNGNLPWKPKPGHSVRATTLLGCECIQTLIACASLCLALKNLTNGG